MNSSFNPQSQMFRFIVRFLVVVVTPFLAAVPVNAQGVSTGTIEGRVSHAGNASYLENARVVIDGTRFETFTDDTGAYRFIDVPAGPGKLRTLFTGVDEQTASGTVRAGQPGRTAIVLGRRG